MNGISKLMEVVIMNKPSIAIDINKSNWNNDNTFTDIIYIDTNSIIEISKQRKYGRLIEDYLIELNSRSGIIIWSQHTIDELVDFLHVDHYYKYAKANGITDTPRKKAWKIAEDTVTNSESINIAQNVYKEADQITSYLEQFGLQTEVDTNLAHQLSRAIHSSSGNNLKDAKHVAAANLSGTNNILTLDAGFLRFSDLNVFGASYEIQKHYSPGQALNDYVDLNKNLIENFKEINKDLDEETEDAI